MSNQRRRGIPEGLVCSGEFRFTELFRRMRNFGLAVDQCASFPIRLVDIWDAPPLTNLCFGDDEEFFPAGVPVYSLIEVRQGYANFRIWRASLPRGVAPYWCREVLLLHEWAQPDPLVWRKLHLLEAASLLSMYPCLGAVRCFSQIGSGNCAELFLRQEKMYVWDGESPSGHHAAYTTAQWFVPERILEEKI